MDVKKRKPLTSVALAGELGKGSDEALQLPDRIARYSKAHKRTLEMVGHLKDRVSQSSVSYPARFREGLVDAQDGILSKLHDDLDSCGNYLVFHNYYTVDRVRLAKARFCKKHYLCPLCAVRRAAKALKANLERFHAIREEHPNLVPYMITLTVRNGYDLGERFTHLQGSFKRYQTRRRLAESRGNGFCELNKVLGAVFSYEVTNKGNGWHPHMHMVALVDPEKPIDKFKLSGEWEELTGDSKIVDVRPMKADSEEELVSSFCEVFKYALKFSDLDVDQNLDAYLILMGKRMSGSFGLFWGVKVPENMTDELLSDLPYIELLYTYTHKYGYAVKDSISKKPVPAEHTRDADRPAPALIEESKREVVAGFELREYRRGIMGGDHLNYCFTCDEHVTDESRHYHKNSVYCFNCVPNG